MRYRIKQLVIITLGLSLAGTLTACGDGNAESSADSRAARPVETDSPQPRVLVASDDEVVVLDGAGLEKIATYDVEARPILSLSGDERHVYALESEADRVSIIDAGTWTDGHGDHGHSFTSEPRQLKSILEGPTTYHAVSDDQRTVVWFDGDGSFQVFDHRRLESDDLRPATFETGTPHHGVAVPTTDGGFLASIADGDHAIGVAVLDASGDEVKRIEGCDGLHGETHVGHDGYAFGCADGILVVEDGEGEKIAAPIDGAGTGSLAGHHDSTVLVGSLSSETVKDAAEHVALYDTETGTSKVVDIGGQYSTFAHAGGVAVVLSTDGALHVVDVETGEVAETLPVIDPWVKSTDWSEPRPQVVVGGDTAWVTDPRDSTVRAVDLASGRLLGQTELDVVPTSLTVVNAAH